MSTVTVLAGTIFAEPLLVIAKQDEQKKVNRILKERRQKKRKYSVNNRSGP